MEASNPPSTVALLPPALNSRPGPVSGVGEEVFQYALAGKYNFAFDSNNSAPDKFPRFSRTEESRNQREGQPRFPVLVDNVSSNVKVYYQNVRGLRSKIEDLFLMTQAADYDAIVLTETWLNDEINNMQLFGDAYNVYRKDRNAVSTGKARGGGVLIAVKSSLLSLMLVTNNRDLEQMWVRIKANDRNIFIGVIYLSPSCSFDPSIVEAHLDTVSKVSEMVAPQDLHLVYGDYNQPNLAWDLSPERRVFLNVSQSRLSQAATLLLDGFSVIGMDQSHTFRNVNNRTLDLLFVNDNAHLCSYIDQPCESLTRIDPHHPPFLTTLRCPMRSQFVDVNSEIGLNFNKCNYRMLCNIFAAEGWSEMYNANDVNGAVNAFTDRVLQILNANVPVKNRRSKPAWSNISLQKLKRKRKAALRSYTRHKNIASRTEFSTASRNYQSYNRLLYKRYVLRKQQSIRRNPKSFWSFVNEKRKESGFPTSMFLGSQVAESQSGICNLFASHFSKAFDSAANLSKSKVNNALRNTPRDTLSMSNVQFDNSDLLSGIAKLKLSFKPGPDGIPSAVFKNCAQVLSRPLLYIFNCSLQQATFPNQWKNSVMFPVFKKGDKRDVENYRGITSLCAGSKLFEIMLQRVLFTHCRYYLSDEQHGFFPGRSVNTNLVRFTSHCIKNMERGVQIDAVYTDLKSAFDKVNHQLLLAKLSRIGVPCNLVGWFNSYLSGRSFKVQLGAMTSNKFVSRSGVPQGSNLGPLLFAIFFNDVCFALPTENVLLYADDLKIFHEIRDSRDCAKLQLLVDIFADWCHRNELTISIPKCCIISFSRLKVPISTEYRINGVILNRVSVVKDLGVLLDSKLTYVEHYNSMVSKANKNLGFIMRMAKEFDDPYCLRSLYYALVRSHLELACVVWCPYSMYWSKRIEAVQSKFVRFALRNLRWNEGPLPPYEHRCQLIAMDTLAQRRSLMKTLFVAKLLLGDIDCGSILSQININVVPRPLRAHSFLRLEYHRTDYGQNEPIRSMCFCFNMTAHLFDFNVSSDMFKRNLRFFRF